MKAKPVSRFAREVAVISFILVLASCATVNPHDAAGGASSASSPSSSAGETQAPSALDAASESASSAPLDGDLSSTSGNPSTPAAKRPTLPTDIDLGLADFFSTAGQLSEKSFEVATTKDIQGIGAELEYYYGERDPAVIELRLGGKFKELTFNAGQADTSEASDFILGIEVYANGEKGATAIVPFNKVKPIKVNVEGVNALKIQLTCKKGEKSARVGKITAVLYSMRLK